jgi:transcriptional regulator with XRE-family HTH domain
MTRLDFLRRERGWSQSALAHALDWDQSSVSRLCNGYPRVPEHVRDKLEQIFHEPVKRLVEEVEVKE